ncbi:MAG: two pore domain potassium channel family protein [Proteobacteria bacterium]|nr:two pore domain potassium channel family protein [Pseudomonadota bacterium]
MTIAVQIFWGSVVLGICSVVHIVVIIWSTSLLKILGPKLLRYSSKVRLGILLGKAFGFVIISHTIQVWILAFSFVIFKAIPRVGDAVYFALTTYTTLGYGDIILDTDFRVYGAMASVTGLLNIGLSTAFLAGLLGRLLPWDKI